ncbi:transposase [Candidatus Peregrinibacteria bacterium]|nr:MAG: transposase [Candidatus Peregrinibacteria bacterium]
MPQSAHTEPSGRKEPIRLIYSLKDSYTAEQIVNLYLERWGIEKSFKRVKQKFQLEKIRVLSLKKVYQFDCSDSICNEPLCSYV